MLFGKLRGLQNLIGIGNIVLLDFWTVFGHGDIHSPGLVFTVGVVIDAFFGSFGEMQLRHNIFATHQVIAAGAFQIM